MKAILTGVPVWSQYVNILRKSRYEILVALLQSAGLTTDYLSFIQPSCTGMELATEDRKAELVQLYIDALQSGIDITTGFLDPQDCLLPAVGPVINSPGFNFGLDLQGINAGGGRTRYLDLVPTVGLPDGMIVSVVNSEGIQFYELSTATTVEALPTISRAGDYSVTNTRIWTLKSVNPNGFVDMTISATNGAVVINKFAGEARIAAGASSVVVTNSLANNPTDYIVQATLGALDTTGLYVRAVVKGVGSFTIHTSANATANLPVMWRITKRLTTP